MLAKMKYIQPSIRAAALTSIHRDCSRAISSSPSSICHNQIPTSLSLLAPHHRGTTFQLQEMLPSSKSRAKSLRHGSMVLFSSQPETTDISQDDNDSGGISDLQLEFASSYHAPVMWKECIDALLKKSHNFKKKRKNKYKKMRDDDNGDEDEATNQNTRNRPRIYIDGTLGGGGHSLCLLQNLSPGDIVIGCDVDPSALATASIRLKDYIVKSDHQYNGSIDDIYKPIFIPLKSNFKDLKYTVQSLKHPITGKKLLATEKRDDTIDEGNENHDNTFIGVDGILLDLGVSSHQIDNAERGFAFMKDGPLDMRMFSGKFNNYDVPSQDQSDDDSVYQQYVSNLNMKKSSGGLTAADICNEFAEEELSRLLKKYGDEPRSRKIAQSIITARPLVTTGDLKEAVALVTPEFVKSSKRMGRTATLARVFQALRIVVNEEDSVLSQALEDMAPSLIGKGGRLVVLAYHSMEDRAAKRVMRDGQIYGRRRSLEKDLYGNLVNDEDDPIPWKPLGKQKATEEEVALNSRARSATLRVAERI